MLNTCWAQSNVPATWRKTIFTLFTLITAHASTTFFCVNVSEVHLEKSDFSWGNVNHRSRPLLVDSASKRGKRRRCIIFPNEAVNNDGRCVFFIVISNIYCKERCGIQVGPAAVRRRCPQPVHLPATRPIPRLASSACCMNEKKT